MWILMDFAAGNFAVFGTGHIISLQTHFGLKICQFVAREKSCGWLNGETVGMGIIRKSSLCHPEAS